jgi:hypothetical protein
MAEDLPGLADPEAAAKLTDKEIVQWVQECVGACTDARRGLEREWDTYTDLYLNRSPADAGEKADWQADIFIPMIFNKVELAKSLVKGALLDAPGSWFALEEYPTFQFPSAQVRFIEKVLRFQLGRSKFIDEYMKALEEGFLLGSGCLKLWWDDWIERSPKIVDMPIGPPDPMTGQPMSIPMIHSMPRPANGLRIQQVPVRSMYPDPYARTFDDAKWVVEECAVDEEELRDGVAAGAYDSIDDIGAPVAFDLETDFRSRETGLSFKAPGPSRKRHLLQIYHGNLYHQGKLALQNWKVVVANKRTIIACGPNPLFTGRFPYIWTTPIPVRGRLWGRSMVSAAATMQVELNNLANEILDSTTLSVLPIVRVDNAKLDEPFEFESVHPGMLLRGRDGAAEQVRIQSVPNDAWPVIQWLQQGIDDATGMRDLMAGKPTAKGRPTAFEIKQAMAGGQESVENLARTLETRDLEPAVQLAYELTMQFLSDTSDPELQAIIQQEGAPPTLADPILRYRVLSAPFKVKARGISMILSRDEQISKRMQLAQMGMQMGIPMPNGPIQLFYGIARLMGMDPREIGQPESPEEMQMLMQQMQAQQAAQAGAGAPGGGPGQTRSVPPEPPQSPTEPPHPNSPQEVTNQVAGMGPPMPGA